MLWCKPWTSLFASPGRRTSSSPGPISPTSGQRDRINKVREYAAVPSIRRYVIIESSSVGLSVFEREGPDEAWPLTVLVQDKVLRMPEIGIEVPVSEIYEGIAFPEQDEAPA